MTVAHNTSTVTVNAAFLQEIKEVNEELWDMLGEARWLCGEPRHIRNHGRRAVDVLAGLRDQLAMQFAVEEAYGYFDDPVHVSPALSASANRVRGEHQMLFASIRDLADEVDDLYRRGQLSEDAARVARLFRAYCDHFQRHENDENRLILDVWDTVMRSRG